MMRQQTRWFRLSAFLLGLTLFAAACSDDDDKKADDAEEETPEEEVPEALAALLKTGDADPGCENESDGELKIGGLLAETGDSAEILGAPQTAGAGLAVDAVNAAGGVNGKPLVYDPKDSGGAEDDLAAPAVAEHLEAGVDAILGASSSEISSHQIETIIDACTIMFSSSNTGPLFTTYEDDDLYFRTAAADILQGRVLAQLAIEDGAANGVILWREDPYGQGLSDYIAAGFEDAGGTIEESIPYDPAAGEFESEVAEVVTADPDALFLVGLDESSAILASLIEAGYTPADKKIYFVEGNMAASVGEAFTTPGALVGVKGTIPGARVADDFRTALLAKDPALTTFTYGPETYDAVTILALAAQAAGTDESAAVAREINGVTRDGTPCVDFKSCKDLLEAGEDIDYNGKSGPVDFAEPGEPTAANYGIYTWTQDNQLDAENVVYKDTKL